PWSASKSAVAGPARYWPKSTTRMPSSGPDIAPPPRSRNVRRGRASPAPRVRLLAPVVHGDGGVVAGAHDLPVAVRLTADHDDVDLLWPPDRDQLVVRHRQLRRERLLAVRRARVDVVLHQLQIPVFARLHRR